MMTSTTTSANLPLVSSSSSSFTFDAAEKTLQKQQHYIDIPEPTTITKPNGASNINYYYHVIDEQQKTQIVVNSSKESTTITTHLPSNTAYLNVLEDDDDDEEEDVVVHVCSNINDNNNNDKMLSMSRRQNINTNDTALPLKDESKTITIKAMNELLSDETPSSLKEASIITTSPPEQKGASKNSSRANEFFGRMKSLPSRLWIFPQEPLNKSSSFKMSSSSSRSPPPPVTTRFQLFLKNKCHVTCPLTHNTTRFHLWIEKLHSPLEKKQLACTRAAFQPPLRMVHSRFGKTFLGRRALLLIATGTNHPNLLSPLKSYTSAANGSAVISSNDTTVTTEEEDHDEDPTSSNKAEMPSYDVGVLYMVDSNDDDEDDDDSSTTDEQHEEEQKQEETKSKNEQSPQLVGTMV